jgi:hypothetical protein
MLLSSNSGQIPFKLSAQPLEQRQNQDITHRSMDVDHYKAHGKVQGQLTETAVQSLVIYNLQKHVKLNKLSLHAHCIGSID